jgi:hypothetical protein
MTHLPVFNGTSQETHELVVALDKWCECYREDGVTKTTCSAHKLMLDQRSLDGLLFMRHMAARLDREEMGN